MALIERALDHRDVPVGTALPVPATRGQLVGAARNPASAAALIVALAAPVNTAALVGNEQLVLIERGQTGEGNEQ